MKHDSRDAVTIAVTPVIPAGSLFCAYAAAPVVVTRLGHLSLAVLVPAFLLLYGVVSVLYLRVLNAVHPLKPETYGMDHSQLVLWKHHAVL